MSSESTRVTRRSLLAATSATTFAVALTQSGVLAQDATPAATPEAQEESQLVIDQTAAQPTELGPAVPPEFDVESNWPTEHANLSGTRAAAGSTIDGTTVTGLTEAWRVPIQANAAYGSMTASPIIIGETVYIQDMASNIWSINAATGEVNWTKEYNVSLLGPNGLAVAYGRVYGALGNSAEVVSVDAETGEEYFRVTLSNNAYEGIDIAPLVYGNTVIVSTVPGNAGSFYQGGSKGIVYGLDADTGKTLWQWDTTTDNLWGNFRVNSGGGLWHPPVVDENGQVYLAVANPAPWPGNAEFPNGTSRPGDNDYSNSLVSLNVDEGKVDWYINVRPHDLVDLDLHLSPMLATVDIDGTATDIVIASGKLGVVVAANRETGEELWRTPVGKHLNDDLEEYPADDFVEVFPGTTGGVETPMAYADGLIFTPIINMSTWFSATEYDGSRSSLVEANGQLTAVDAATGEIAWDVTFPSPQLAGAAVANDIVFTGGLDGVVHGLDTKTGEEVFTYQAPAGLNAPLAIAGDTLYIPAGGPLIATEDTEDPQPELAQVLIALRIG